MGKPKAPHERFSKLPHHVQFSPAFRNLSHAARALLLDIVAMERGNNNGDLLVTHSTFHPMGWTVKNTFYAALDALIEGDLLVVTMGSKGAGRRARRFALPWLPVARNRPESVSKMPKTVTTPGETLVQKVGPISSETRTHRFKKQDPTPVNVLKTRTQGGVLGVDGSYFLRLSASCQGDGVSGTPWTPGSGDPMTLFVSQSDGAFSLSTRLPFQTTPKVRCEKTSDPDAVLIATRQALGIATANNAVLRLVGDSEVLRRFDPVLDAAKAMGALPAPEDPPDVAGMIG